MRNAKSARKRPKQPVVHRVLHKHFRKFFNPLPVVLLPVPVAVLLYPKVRANLTSQQQQVRGPRPTKMLKMAKKVLAPELRVKMRILLPRLTQKLMINHLSLEEAPRVVLPEAKTPKVM